MRQFPFKIVLGGFLIAFLLLLSSIYESVQRSNELFNDFQLITHSYEIINGLESLKTHLSRAEAEKRGYILTMNLLLMESFAEDTTLLKADVERVENLIVNDRFQQEKHEELRLLLGERLGLMRVLLGFFDRGEHQSEAFISTINKANDVDLEIYATIDQMKTHEKAQLDNYQLEAAKDLTQTRRFIVFSGVSSMLIGILFILMVRADYIRSKNVERELRSLNDNKDRFFSIISHDLKGPVYAAKKLLEMINDPRYKEERNKMMGMMQQSMDRVTSLLESLLEWSRTQMNSILFHPDPLCLKTVVEETMNNLQTIAESKNIKIHNMVDESYVAFADQYMTSAIIRNLLNNALKFTQAGKNIYVEGSQGPKGFVSVSVRDEGVGINEKTRESLFKVGGKSTRGTHQEVGTGLGLVLVKEFVEKHGGKIWVESEEGKGTTFTFTLPEIKRL
jgi:two-component system, sensor histidine kinase and response regulator